MRDLFKKALKSMSVSLTSSLNFSSAEQSSTHDESLPAKQRSKPPQVRTRLITAVR